ncbi:hypothetical protein [Comamonas aquatica]|uniref:Uncharacterized protein n=1 Tax=Comamonas aquatica TaxID=225991 RepID=A0AA42L7J1_9BURK|nr:hypothetical protein [Comamonas aquatica]MDH0363451.1 hypothetical protein [Comamonas aquatica]
MTQQQTTNQHRVLPLPWVEKIFEKLGVTYGRDFLARWDGFDADAMAAVKYDWCMELGGFFDKPDAIAYGLAHLPAKSPNVLEFRDICRRAPQPELKKLPRPVQDPQAVADVVGVVKSKLTKLPAVDPKGWALKLKARHERGEKLGSHQVHAYRQALGLDGRQSWQ